MPLKHIEAPELEKPSASVKPITLDVAGDAVKLYNEAAAAAKLAEETMKRLRPVIIGCGQPVLFRHNCNESKEPATSIKLKDDKGCVVRMQFNNKYSAVEAEAAEALFTGLETVNGKPADINNYVREVMTAKFEAKVFLNDRGDFDVKKYNAYRRAIETVAKAYADECPLSTAKQVVPVADFHEKRWLDFPYRVQARITEVLRNVIALVPCPPEAVQESAGK